MTVLATTAVPDHVRGALTRWMIEPTPGLYVGTLSARVRDELWSVVTASIGPGAAVLVHPAPTEQGFTLHTAGERRRIPIDFDGLTLVAFRPEDDNDVAANPAESAEPTDGHHAVPMYRSPTADSTSRESSPTIATTAGNETAKPL